MFFILLFFPVFLFLSLDLNDKESWNDTKKELNKLYETQTDNVINNKSNIRLMSCKKFVVTVAYLEWKGQCNCMRFSLSLTKIRRKCVATGPSWPSLLSFDWWIKEGSNEAAPPTQPPPTCSCHSLIVVDIESTGNEGYYHHHNLWEKTHFVSTFIQPLFSWDDDHPAVVCPLIFLRRRDLELNFIFLMNHDRFVKIMLMRKSVCLL